MRLAMAQSLEEENEIKQDYINHGIKFVVTEVGGSTQRDFQDKATRSIIGAALNMGLIEKCPHEIHALIHACEEAKRGIMVNSTSESNLALKIAIVRQPRWICVAMFGESAIHALSGHERCGMGIMNI